MAFSLHSSSSPSPLTLGFLLPKKQSFFPVRSSRSMVPPRLHVHCSATPQTQAEPPLRRSGNYKPSIWHHDHIQQLKDDYMEEKFASRIGRLKDATRRLIGEEKDVVNQLRLVDTLRQLGVAYHFEQEIKDALGKVYASAKNTNMVVKDDIYTTALLFRLLREHSFSISQDVFDSFRDESGEFVASLCRDTRGMLSLYEASYVEMEGEHKLEQAREFTTRHLKAIKGQDIVPKSLRKHVEHALDMPLYWSMPRLHTRWFIDAYQEDDDMNPILLEFAKMDFNVVQGQHKRELKGCSSWWNSLGLFENKLSFARDRLVENFLWSMGWAFEPKYRFYRETLTRVNSLVTTMDDIYDVYGTLDELELFTAAVDRWDASAIRQLPEYMKIFYLALIDTTNDTAYNVLRMKGVDCVHYLKKAWTELAKAFLVEAKWAHGGYIPTTKEYLENAWISISGPVLLTHSFFCISEKYSKEALQCFEDYANIIRRPSMILRLWDDMGGATVGQEETKKGDVKKSIQCYMLDEGVSEVVALRHMRELIRETWKEMNADRFASSPFEKPFVDCAVNLARMAQFMYHHGEGYTDPNGVTKDRIMSLIIEPIPMDPNK